MSKNIKPKPEYFFQSRAKKTSLFIFALAIILSVAAVYLSGCAASADQKESVSIEKTTIEKAVKQYWNNRDASRTVTSLSYKKFDDTIYLVGCEFADTDTNSINVVARKFENASGTDWKIEPFNERWRGILRIEPQ